jgi:hypothetical protein
MTPKLTMKETMSVVDAMPNSSDPMSGTTVLSIPTMPPTNALISMSSPNCPMFAPRPRRTSGPLARWLAASFAPAA